MLLARVALAAVLLAFLVAPSQAEKRTFHLRGRPHGHRQVYGGYGGGRKILDSASPSRVIVNGEVVFESKPANSGNDSPPALAAPPCPLGTLPSFGFAGGMTLFGGGPPPVMGLGSPPPSYGYGSPPPAGSDAPRLGYFFNGMPCTPIPPPPSPPSPAPPAEFDDHGGEDSSGKGKGSGKDDSKDDSSED